MKNPEKVDDEILHRLVAGEVLSNVRVELRAEPVECPIGHLILPRISSRTVAAI